MSRALSALARRNRDPSNDLPSNVGKVCADAHYSTPSDLALR